MERRELPRYPVIDAAATGRNLRRLRLEKGYSVKGLQEYLGLGCPQGVYQWQAGRSLPSVDNLYAVSRLWGVSMSYHIKPARKETISLMSKSITQDMAYRQSLRAPSGR